MFGRPLSFYCFTTEDVVEASFVRNWNPVPSNVEEVLRPMTFEHDIIADAVLDRELSGDPKRWPKRLWVRTGRTVTRFEIKPTIVALAEEITQVLLDTSPGKEGV